MRKNLKYVLLNISSSTAVNNFLQLSHFDNLDSFLATYLAIAVATSALFLSRTLSEISHFLV